METQTLMYHNQVSKYKELKKHRENVQLAHKGSTIRLAA